MKACWSAFACLLLIAAAGPLPPSSAADESATHYYIWGEVMNPGAYPCRRGLTVAQAIEDAGGFTEVANRNRATLTRGERQITLSREDLTQRGEAGVLVEPGDVIRIEKGAITVAGEVRKPGDYGLEHASVRQALIAAGGPTPMADLDSAYIARGGRVIRVDARKVLAGGPGVENPKLEPGDVLHVPRAEARVTIAGEVRRPGSYTLEAGKIERLEDLIAAAGGPTPNARTSRVELRRAPRAGERAITEIINLEDPRKDELQRNPVLQSGDHVLVPAMRRGRSLSINDVYQIGILVLTLISILSRN